MKSLSSLLNNPEQRIKRLISQRIRSEPRWWTPVWRGLSADPKSKHRAAMGTSLWLYLYLLTYTNRRTGQVRRRMDQIEADTGYPLRTIQRYLKCLVQRNYITYFRSRHYLHITIKRWKSFHDTTNLSN